MKNNKLKPCPFCGSPPSKVAFLTAVYTMKCDFKLECQSCGATVGLLTKVGQMMNSRRSMEYAFDDRNKIKDHDT